MKYTSVYILAVNAKESFVFATISHLNRWIDIDVQKSYLLPFYLIFVIYYMYT